MTAFLYALVKDHKIYVEQPYGYVQYAKDGSALVCLLLKSLYGLKQAPFLWFEELTSFLKSKGFNLIRPLHLPALHDQRYYRCIRR